MKPRTVAVILEVETDLTGKMLERALRAPGIALEVLRIVGRGNVFQVRQVNSQVIDATKRGGAP